MKKSILLISLSILFFLCSAKEKTITVSGFEDRQPIAGAIIFDKTGIIKGSTDEKGQIPHIGTEDFPLTVKCLGYNNTLINEANDSVFLETMRLPLREIVITPGDRPVTRFLGYGREYMCYATPTDTMQAFTECILEIFIGDKKLKGFKKSDSNKPRIRGAKTYKRFTDNKGKDSISTKNNGMLTDKWFTIKKQISESEALRSGSRQDVVQGKFGPKTVMIRTDEFFKINEDNLADYKGHRWSPPILKVLGMTTEFSEMKDAYAFSVNETGTYTLEDLIYKTSSLRMFCTGKLVKFAYGSKDPVEMYMYLELYPLEITHHTVEDYLEMREDNSPLELRISPLAPPLDSFIENIIEKATQK